VNIKMNGFVGNILQNKFCACCCILLSSARSKCRSTPTCGAALLLYTTIKKCQWATTKKV